MANKAKSIGRAYLVKKLQDRGLSRGQATCVVNAVLEAMIKALRQSKEVKFPFGKLRRVRNTSARIGTLSTPGQRLFQRHSSGAVRWRLSDSGFGFFWR
jgi:nucleoid DNA-binding protein